MNLTKTTEPADDKGNQLYTHLGIDVKILTKTPPNQIRALYKDIAII